MASELNKMFANTPLHILLSEERIAFCYHPEVYSGALGKEYKEGTKKWANGGALEQLMTMLDKDVPGKIPKFVAGAFGSVWFDVNLTGGSGVDKRTKKVRVTPMRKEDGGWNIMLDNTFEEKW